MSFFGGWKNSTQGNKYRVCFEKAYGSDMAWKSQHLVIGGRVKTPLVDRTNINKPRWEIFIYLPIHLLDG